MARSNKKKSGGHLIPLPFSMMLIVIAVLALCYLWMRQRCDAIGNELKALETRKAAAERLHLSQESELANLKSPQNVDRALRQHGLLMTWPSSDQIVRVPEADGPWAEAYTLTVDTNRSTALRRVVMND